MWYPPQSSRMHHEQQHTLLNHNRLPSADSRGSTQQDHKHQRVRTCVIDRTSHEDSMSNNTHSSINTSNNTHSYSIACLVPEQLSLPLPTPSTSTNADMKNKNAPKSKEDDDEATHSPQNFQIGRLT